MIIKHIVFEEMPAETNRVTKKWRIRAINDNIVLGHVYFWAHWRKYIFGPETATVYDSGCLHEIASFLDEQTDLHKRGLQ